jgi:uncharacterized membrane protein YraQ (UPF0718 family)
MMKRIMEKIGARWVFLFLVVVLYGIVGIIDFEMLQDTLPVLGRLVLRIFPVLLLVFGIMFVTNLFFGDKSIVKRLGKGSGCMGWIFAITGGIISSGPIYMWYPLLSDLKERGMRDRLIAAFLYSRAIKIPLIPMMVFYFGWPFTTILSLYMVLFSVPIGVIVERLARGGQQ